MSSFCVISLDFTVLHTLQNKKCYLLAARDTCIRKHKIVLLFKVETVYGVYLMLVHSIIRQLINVFWLQMRINQRTINIVFVCIVLQIHLI